MERIDESGILVDPRFTPGPDSPAWLAAMGEADKWVERKLEYDHFLRAKVQRHEPCGFDFPEQKLNRKLFDFQRAIVRWGLRAGRCAFFEDCGLGKTPQQLEWAERTGKSVLIFAPLAVAEQTETEGRKFGIKVTLCESQSDIQPGVNVTNYEKLHHFNSEPFGGIVLDESSILKSLDGSTRKALTEFSVNIPYRLCCTATPAPNDYMELGMHSEFLGIMKHTEMLSMFFVHDGGDTAKWRLKKHAKDEFWKWVCSWAVAIRKPSDLGFDDSKLDAERAISAELLDAVKDALAFLDRPDITTYEWYKLAPEHVGKFRRAITKAEGK